MGAIKMKEGDMKGCKLWMLALIAALGGFLFGFDTIVINGAEQDIQRFWRLSSTMHGCVVSSALWGTVGGALVGGWIADWIGRRMTLCIVGWMYFVSALWSALALDPWCLMLARMIGGVGVGVSTIAAPIYIAEVSPQESRGKMTAAFQLNIVLGILVALASNLLLKDLGENAWRYMLGAECVPAALFVVLSPLLCESQRFTEMRHGMRSQRARSSGFWSRKNSGPILLAIMVAFFNQMSGCNAINYFAPRIFGMAGLGRDSQFVSTFGLGILNFAGTFCGLWLIDRLGRKTLLLIGGIGYLVSLSLAAIAFAFGNGALSSAMIFLFMVSHAVGQGTVIWVLISESFPQQFRAQGQAVGAFTHWILAAVVALVFPVAADRFAPSSIFGFFAGMMVLHLLWVVFVVRETKGKVLE